MLITGQMYFPDAQKQGLLSPSSSCLRLTAQLASAPADAVLLQVQKKHEGITPQQPNSCVGLSAQLSWDSAQALLQSGPPNSVS